MKIFLLKILFINQTKDKGYVIPIVFALGLIMTLIGTISIFQSGDDEIISISQRKTSQALAAAEAGVSRYRELINSYKVIAMYDACNDVDTDTDEIGDKWGTGTTCSEDSGVISWASGTIPNLNTSYCPAEGSTIGQNAANIQALASRNWQNIGSDATQGQYRLIDYIYNPGTYDGTTASYDPQPTGTLTVEGRVNQNNTTLANEQGAAVSSIQVELPVQPGIQNPDGNISIDSFLNGFNPALWITGATGDIDLGDIRVNGNIVVTDADCDFSDGSGNEYDLPVTDDFFNSANNSVVVDPRSVQIFPDPTATLPPGVTDIADINEIELTELTTESLPINGATSTTVNGDVVYYYKLTDGSGTAVDLVLAGGNTINIRRNSKVVLFVEGNINMNADGGAINVNPDTVNNSSHLEIYLTDSGGTIGSIQFEGNSEINIKALLHAPGSPVTVVNEPNVTFTGAMWVENFIGNTVADFDINVDSAGSAIAEAQYDQYLNYTFVNNVLIPSNARVADPIIAPPSSWETQATQ